MEQIYYSQCPIGYGLGASNGFQIKRIGAGYPPSGDVRHLALRPFLSGSNGKQLAPGTLRYRRVGPIAEVAWLEPRSREYETERGQWGRPGGHFAHGLRLDPEEFDAIAHWPAGLYDRPCWRRSDPQPSQGRRPDDLTIGPEDLMVPPSAAQVSSLIDLDPERFASLLAKTAEAVRTGRTLFILDDPGRLGPRIAALTFAFPTALRSELTFSTYHDRPEELSGFRIHGSVPSPSVNRALLASLGPLADLTTDRPEPSENLPSWARSLASWLTHDESINLDLWNETNRRCRVAKFPEDPAVLWSDSWLDGLIGLVDASRSPLPHPQGPEQWRALSGQVAWASRAGLLHELTDLRRPEWWRVIASQASREPLAYDAFWMILLSPDTWQSATAADAKLWGRIAAHFWSRLPGVQREQRLNAIVQKIASPELLARALDGLISTVPPASGRAALHWLERRSSIDPAVLLPLRARNAVGLVIEASQADGAFEVLSQAMSAPQTLPVVLDMIAEESNRRTASDQLAPLIARMFESAPTESRGRFETWALGRRSIGENIWIGSTLSLLFKNSQQRADWNDLRDRIDRVELPNLASACLDVSETIPERPDAFLWSVESLLLGLPDGARPGSAGYAATYLDRVGSPLELATRLRQFRDTLPDWLASARSHAKLSASSVAKLDDANALLRLMEGSGELPTIETLARLPDRDRPAVLGLAIEQVASGHFEPSREILVQLVRCWPSSFSVNTPSLDQITEPLAGLLLQFLPEPEHWVDRLKALLEWIEADRTRPEHCRWGGIASRIVSKTCRLTADQDAAWKLRAVLIREPELYAALADDLAHQIRSEHPSLVINVVERWDLRLDKGRHSDRFFEVLLNIARPGDLYRLVPNYAAALKTLGPMPWWSSPVSAELVPSDLREAFAWLCPIAPISAPGQRSHVEAWVSGTSRSPRFQSVLNDPDAPLLVDFAGAESGPTDLAGKYPSSHRAKIRWQCIMELTDFHALAQEDRWRHIERWKPNADPDAVPPVPRLDPDDQDDFLGWLLKGLDHPGKESYRLEMLARRLVNILKIRSPDRVIESLDSIKAKGAQIPDESDRLARDLAFEVRRQR